MNLFIDTNIALEIILDQERAEEARELLASSDQHRFFISDFSIYSIGILLVRKNQKAAFKFFLTDMIRGKGMNIIKIPADELESVLWASEKFNLGFDDAYQYMVAAKYDLAMVSFDGDFDRTDRGRKTPAQILK